MPNVMVALSNIGGAYKPIQRRKVWLSNAAKTRNPLKFTGVPQTTGSISVVSRPKFTTLWGRVEDILLLNKFFPIVDTCPVAKI